MRRRLAAITLVAFVLIGLAAVGAVLIDGTEPDERGVALAQEQPDPDNTVTRIELQPGGSATWAVTFRTRLATDEDVAEYERFQGSFRADTGRYLDPFEERMRGVVDRANDSHDREMRATAFDATTTIQEVPRRWGVVTFRFSWAGFAATEEGRVVMGDVFDGGFYIGEQDVLEVVPPRGFVVAEADPSPDEVGDGLVEWRGREDFIDGRPRVVAEPADETGAGRFAPLDDRGTLLLSGFVATLLALTVAYRFRGRLRSPAAGSDESPSANDNIPSADDPSGAADRTVDSGLLTDEDRVRRVLGEHGGRMKQSAIVEELGWSKSKASRVLSQMADDGAVEKLRIGRENVIDLLDDE